MALDKTGITIDEVVTKRPRQFQTLGYDVLLDTDETYKPKVISTFELCINSILTLLRMKPGQYPSIPELGIDVESYLFEYADDHNTPMEIENKLRDQCNRIEISGVSFKCELDQTEDGTNALVVKVDGNDTLCYGLESSNVIIGITYDKLNRLYSKIVYI